MSTDSMLTNDTSKENFSEAEIARLLAEIYNKARSKNVSKQETLASISDLKSLVYQKYSDQLSGDGLQMFESQVEALVNAIQDDIDFQNKSNTYEAEVLAKVVKRMSSVNKSVYQEISDAKDAMEVVKDLREQLGQLESETETPLWAKLLIVPWVFFGIYHTFSSEHKEKIAQQEQLQELINASRKVPLTGVKRINDLASSYYDQVNQNRTPPKSLQSHTHINEDELDNHSKTSKTPPKREEGPKNSSVGQEAINKANRIIEVGSNLSGALEKSTGTVEKNTKLETQQPEEVSSKGWSIK